MGICSFPESGACFHGKHAISNEFADFANNQVIPERATTFYDKRSDSDQRLHPCRIRKSIVAHIFVGVDVYYHNIPVLQALYVQTGDQAELGSSIADHELLVRSDLYYRIQSSVQRGACV